MSLPSFRYIIVYMVKSKQIIIPMKKINFLFLLVILAVVVLFSLGKTLDYYFFTDDYAFLYYLGNNLEFGWPYNSVLFYLSCSNLFFCFSKRFLFCQSFNKELTGFLSSLGYFCNRLYWARSI